jgi:hypothetical protein
MHIGASFIAAAVYGAIEKNLKKGSQSSLRDYQRAIKRVIEIVSVQLKQQETQQNDSEEVAEELVGLNVTEERIAEMAEKRLRDEQLRQADAVAEGEIVDWQEVQRQWDEYYAQHPEDAPQTDEKAE